MLVLLTAVFSAAALALLILLLLLEVEEVFLLLLLLAEEPHLECARKPHFEHFRPCWPSKVKWQIWQTRFTAGCVLHWWVAGEGACENVYNP